MDRLAIAFRYLLHRPISIASLLGVLVGVGALVLVDSVMNGFLREQQEIIRGTQADVTVTLPREQRTRPADVEAIMQAIRQEPGVAGVALRLEAPSLYTREGRAPISMGVSSLGGYHFVRLVGIDPADERQVIDLDRFLEVPARHLPANEEPPPAQHLHDPFWFDIQDPYWSQRVEPRYHYAPLVPIRFGATLAGIMGLRPGQVLLLATWSQADADGHRQPRTRRFVVCGTFETQDLEFDLTRAFVPRSEVRDLAGIPDIGHEVILSCAEGHAEDEVRDALQERLAGFGVAAADVETWADRKQVLLRAVENERRALIIVLFLMIVVAAFNLLVTLYMMVSEKIRDIGMLTALGASASRVAGVFLMCGFLVTALGALLGLAFGLLVTWNINELLAFFGVDLFNHKYYVFQSIPTEVDGERLAVFVGATLACTFLFVLPPALRAARQDPVEALRHG